MSAKKIVLVVGATGKQGGSVVSSILSDSKASQVFKIRGVTRDTSKPAAKALEAKGVETVTASLDDSASLKAAMKDVYAVFAMTNYWDSMSGEKEYQQGVNIVDAAKSSNVEHLVLSVLKDVNKLSKGEFPHVYHFDAKARIGEYAKSSGVPTTYFLPGFYMDNLTSNIAEKDGKWTFNAVFSEKAPIPLFNAAKDTGLFVKNILLNREKTLGKEVLGATDYYTPLKMIEEFKKAKPEAGESLTFNQLPVDVFKQILQGQGMPPVIQEELLENMLFMEPYGYYGGESLEFSHSILDKSPTTFEEYVASESKWKDVK